ncbi:hypothetical protein [Bradyrhizobium australiense]|uniref:Uncharacterized protein n=1 Tax=Bradyrhizobium australiense TaxID=2721161 RepID=A0A7Y4LWP9_9BRAD|nr:hypothetical protein [Bradyrhizobium australiense]NOJ41384.1 hypothetical protein [Bradyrhizobium australiense]
MGCSASSADAVRSDQGRFIRDNVSKWWWENAYKTIIVDTRSGSIKLGDAAVTDWFIQQKKVDGDWDFVASSADTRVDRVAADHFRLRVPREKSEPIEFVFVMNGFSIYTGTCDALY